MKNNNKYKSIIKTLTYIVSVFAFLFAASVVYAADATVTTPTGSTFNPFNVPTTDLSVQFLGQIFGNIPGAIPYGVQTILGNIFYYFNSSMLIIAGVVLTYGTFKFIIELSHHHDQMQRKYTYWQPLRVVMGFGLLVPLPTGYSALNSIIMWTIIQGVGLADTVWDKAVDYMSHSGVLTTASSGTSQSTMQDLLYVELIQHNRSGPIPDYISGSSDILRSLVCMYSMQYALEDQRVNHYNKDYASTPDNNEVVLTPSFEQADANSPGYIYFPGSFTDTTLLNYVNTQSTSLPDPKGHCGSYTWTDVPKMTNMSNDQQQGQTDYINAKKTGAMQMIAELDAIAQLIAQTSNGTDPDDVQDPAVLKETNFQDQINNTMLSAAADYQANIYPTMMYASQGYKPPSTSNTDSSQNVTIDTSQGWVAAGRYYYDLIKIHNANTYASNGLEDADINKTLKGGLYETGTQNQIGTQTGPDGIPPPYYCTQNQSMTPPTDIAKQYVYPYFGGNSDRIDNMTQTIDNLCARENATISLANSINAANTSATSSADLPTALQNMVTDNKFSISLGGANVVFGVGTLVVLYPVNQAIQSTVSSWYKFFIKRDIWGYSPFLALQAFGNKLISEGVDVWHNVFVNLNLVILPYTAASFYMTGVNTALGILNSLLGVGMGGQLVVNQLQTLAGQLFDMFIKIPVFMLLPVATAVSGMMIVMGITYAYYVPLVPYMLFLFGTITWLITVFEAMAASPVIALAISHPEGTHDVLGKAEDAVGLIFSVFLRPVCLVMGLIASIILTYVALNVLNTTFGGVINSLFYNNQDLARITNLPGSSGGVIDQIAGGAMIMIYLLIVMALYNQCNALIYTLVNKILQYARIHAPQGEEGRLVEGVKSGFEGMTKEMTGSLTGIMPKEMIRGNEAKWQGPKKKSISAAVESEKPSGGVEVK